MVAVEILQVLHRYNYISKPLLAAIARSSQAFRFAARVIQAPFPLGEPSIAKDPYQAYYYARYILKGPFPLGEAVIAKDGLESYAYAKYILKGPFPLGEATIAENQIWAEQYHQAKPSGQHKIELEDN